MKKSWKALEEVVALQKQCTIQQANQGKDQSPEYLNACQQLSGMKEKGH